MKVSAPFRDAPYNRYTETVDRNTAWFSFVTQSEDFSVRLSSDRRLERLVYQLSNRNEIIYVPVRGRNVHTLILNFKERSFLTRKLSDTGWREIEGGLCDQLQLFDFSQASGFEQTYDFYLICALDPNRSIFRLETDNLLDMPEGVTIRGGVAYPQGHKLMQKDVEQFVIPMPMEKAGARFLGIVLIQSMNAGFWNATERRTLHSWNLINANSSAGSSADMSLKPYVIQPFFYAATKYLGLPQSDLPEKTIRVMVALEEPSLPELL